MNPQTAFPATAAADAADAGTGPLDDRFADTGARLAPERQRAVIERLRTILPAHCLLYREEDTRPYECDGLSAFRQLPVGVALPETEEQVRAILKACSALDVPVVARGAGTSLSGGSMPHASGIVLSMAKFNRVLSVDPLARIARVQPGVRNLAISEAAAVHRLYYAPDPSSQIACSIGGNVAENAGGVHCLKYGLTVHNVLQVRGYTVEGEPLTVGGLACDCPGPDLFERLDVAGSELLAPLGLGIQHGLLFGGRRVRPAAVLRQRGLPGRGLDRPVGGSELRIGFGAVDEDLPGLRLAGAGGLVELG